VRRARCAESDRLYIAKYLRPHFDATLLREISGAQIETFKTGLAPASGRSKPLAPKTVHSILTLRVSLLTPRATSAGSGGRASASRKVACAT
jgi:hypothetical protein